MKKLIYLILFLVFSISSQAQVVVKVQDYVSKGNIQASVQGMPSTNKLIGSYPGATVAVYLTGTVTLATIYSDSSLTPKSNPFTADSEGRYEFYIAPGDYDLRFSGTGIASPFTRTKVNVSTPGVAFTGSVDYLQRQATTNTLGDSLLSQSGTEIRNSGKIDLRGGYTTSTYAGLAGLSGSSGYGRTVYVTDKYRFYIYMGAQWVPFGDYDVKLAGAKCDGSTNDTAIINNVIQAAIDEYAGSGSKRGAIVNFPVGTCRADIVVTEARGITLHGQGRFSTILQPYTAGASTLKFNGLWYSRVEGFFLNPNGVTTLPMIDLDGNWDGTHTLRVQGNSFRDIYLNGNYQGAVGLELCRQGGSIGQCSENSFSATHITGFTSYGFIQTGFNALQNKIHDASNFQGNTRSVRINSGNIHIQNVGFQEYANLGTRAHIDSGPMIDFRNSSDDLSTIRDCRFEGFPMVRLSNGHRLIFEGNYVLPSGIGAWAANTAYSQGAIIKGTDGGTGGKGRLYVAMNSGTTGASDPGWADPDEAYSWTGGAIDASSQDFNCSSCGNLYNTKTGYGIVIAGAGTSGGYYYGYLGTWVSNSAWTLSTPANTTVTSAPYHISPVITDGGINWMPYEFDEMVVGGGGSAVIRNNTFGNGRIHTGNNANLANYYSLEITGNTFARKDWLAGGSVNYAQARITNNDNIVNLNGGPNTGGAAVAFPATYRNGGSAPIEKLSAFWIGQKTFGWAGGNTGGNLAEIYFDPDLNNNRVKFKGGKLVFDDLTNDRMLYLNSNKEVAVSGITTTVMQYLDPTSSVQAQLDSKAPASTPSFTNNATFTSGDILLATAGKSLQVKTGSNACSGATALVGGTATISTTCTPATLGTNGIILITSQVDGGTPGSLRVSAYVASTSFTITSSSGTDTSTIGWLIIKQN